MPKEKLTEILNPAIPLYARELHNTMFPYYDRLFRISVVGYPGAGKRSLIHRFTDDKYIKHYTGALKTDFQDITLEELVVKIRLDIPKNCSQEQNQSTYVHKGNSRINAVVLVYDSTNKDSLESLKTWLEIIKQQTRKNTPIILVATKTDLYIKREITLKMGSEFAESWNLNNEDHPITSHIETSAKDNVNVSEVFQEATRQILKQQLITNKPVVNPQAQPDSMRIELEKRLQKYIDRVNGYRDTNGKQDFGRSQFVFFKDAQTINRQANLKLAQRLLKDLGNPNNSLADVFQDYEKKRKEEAFNYTIHPGTTRVRSWELAGIINDALKESARNPDISSNAHPGNKRR
ncbi:ADP-ribosylation factor-like protein [Legionella worsleiensis]|uniref:Ras family GTPase n=1 Tax=Legionella worsleiensis TaxID=45076 RepID=A0A0W1A9D4_9GAMM|nr:ADP-ribosylation factor-like protein [Legionella worsleiensis]KTD77950.1 Ras family GTPase [Legionella worsleiensis]STY31612.1 Ras family GTPase [Legionella worsleiensis]